MTATLVLITLALAIVFAVDVLIRPIPYGNRIVGIGSGLVVIVAICTGHWLVALLALAVFAVGYYVYRLPASR